MTKVEKFMQGLGITVIVILMLLVAVLFGTLLVTAIIASWSS